MKIFFSVGEPSGDQHAAHLIDELRRRRPGIQCVGYGGPLMASAGCQLRYPLTNSAVMGLLHVIPLLWRFFRLMRKAAAEFRTSRPDAVILVDFPGFNWWIARKAKRLGIPVFYYCPPQLWAWAPWRIKKMRRFVDHVLCCLRFETDWYLARGMDAECMGHPFFDEIADRKLDDAFLARHRTDAATTGPIVGILPGSRNHEVHGNWPIQLRVMERISRQVPGVRFLVACYRESQQQFCAAHFAGSKSNLTVEFCVGRTPEIIELAEMCLMVSGSVSLELLARKTPAVVLYRCDWIYWLAGRLLITCKYMSLPNLIAGRLVMPEFIVVGNPARVIDRISRILGSWLTNRGELESQVRALEELHGRIVKPGATARTAAAILRRLPEAAPASFRKAA